MVSCTFNRKLGFDFLVFSSRGGQSLEMNLVTVYDIQNKFIAYSAPIPEVIDVLSEWGSLYVLAGDRRVRLYSHCVLSGDGDGGGDR